MTFVANQSLRVPPSLYLKALRVPAGFDVADNEIVKRVALGDLVITADIPLAAEVLEKGGAALNPRSERYSPATIWVRCAPAACRQAVRQQFANALDSWLTLRQR